MQDNPFHYDQDAINELINRACDDPQRLMEELHIDCRQQGKRYAGACPVHGGDNPGAFNFYPDGDTARGIWICRTHACHLKFKKNLIGLIRGVTGCSFNQALNWLLVFNGLKKLNDVKLPSNRILERRRENAILRKLNIQPEQKTKGWTRDWVRKTLDIPADYYVNRGYSREILDRYDVGFYKPMNRISVPIFDDDHKFCLGFSARSIYEECEKCGLYHNPKDTCPVTEDDKRSANKWRISKGFESSNYLYNYWFAKNHIARDGVAILVEGPGDVWRLEQNNIHISLGLFGVELTDQQRVLLDRSGALSLIILLDNDDAGKNAARILQKTLHRSYRLYFPTIKAEDAGDLHKDEITNDIKPFIVTAMNGALR